MKVDLSGALAVAPAPELHTVRVLVPANPGDVVILLDGEPITNIDRLTLTMDASGRAATLTLARLAMPNVATTSRDGSETVTPLDEMGHVADVYAPELGDTIDVEGVARLVEESARVSLAVRVDTLPVFANEGDRAECNGHTWVYKRGAWFQETTDVALQSFMVKLDGSERAVSLADLLRDAERYRAMRRTIAGDGVMRVESIATGSQGETWIVDTTELDTYADELREQHGLAGDGEPRRPL